MSKVDSPGTPNLSVSQKLTGPNYSLDCYIVIIWHRLQTGRRSRLKRHLMIYKSGPLEAHTGKKHVRVTAGYLEILRVARGTSFFPKADTLLALS